MDSQSIVRMANDIANFFAPYPEADAVEGVRDHLMKFWDPGMRKDLVNVVTGLAPSVTAVHPLVLRAVRAMQRGNE